MVVGNLVEGLFVSPSKLAAQKRTHDLLIAFQSIQLVAQVRKTSFLPFLNCWTMIVTSVQDVLFYET